MKVLILVSAICAAASAGFIGPAAYHGVHVPVLDQNGYQIDNADVAHAKAAHFAAHAEANARLAGHVVAPHGLVSPLAYAGHYAGPQHIPVIGPNGVPVDTPEVAAGKAANAAAHVEAKARNGDLALVAPVAAYAHGYAAAPVAIANGVPLDTPEVAHAKAAHFAAHVDAKVRNGDLHAYAHPLVHYRKRRGVFGAAYAAPIALAHAYPQHIPVIGPNGVPLETPEVVAAKASHAAAHVEAAARNGNIAVVAPLGYAAGIASHGVVGPLAYAGPQHIPVIGPNGVPVDTPEVASAKAANAAAHVEAKVRNGDLAVAAPFAPLNYAAAHGVVSPLAYAHSHYSGIHVPVIGPNGVPLDTPEVAAGKVANAVAHAEAKARNGDLVYHY